MSAELDFRNRALAYAPLVELVGQRVAVSALPSGSSFPLVAFTARHDPQYCLDGTIAVNEVSIEAQCWGKSLASCQAVADALTAAVVHTSATTICTMTDSSVAYDDERDLNAVIVNYEWLI